MKKCGKFLAGSVLFCTALLAQGPVTDRLTVEFKDPVLVGDATLPAGQYTVRQLDTASNPRVFEFVAADGTRTEATASAAPILDNFARHPTSVVLTRKGNNLQLSRIWIEGQSYGYEFTAPEGPEIEIAAQGNRTLTMTGAYTPPGPSREQLEAERRQREEQERLAAQQRAEQERLAAQQRADQERADQERLAAQRREEEERQRQEQERLAQQQREREERERTIAQTTPPPPPPAESKPAPMPATASGWPAMMLGGLLGIAAGAMVRRFRA
jgi:hypothetical protein